MPRVRPEVLVLDLDGVLRTFDPAVAAGIEHAHHLAPGTLASIAMRWDLLQEAVTGRITHEAWLDAVESALVEQVGLAAPAARAAVDQWQSYCGEVAPPVLAFVREVRAAGVPVGLATNATTRLDADLAKLGLTGEVDVIVNSSVLGVHKPAREFFHEVCAAVRRRAELCLFVDDQDRNVSGARVAGLNSYRWNGPQDLPYLRAALGLA